jgi:hypothetical protein
MGIKGNFRLNTTYHGAPARVFYICITEGSERTEVCQVYSGCVAPTGLGRKMFVQGPGDNGKNTVQEPHLADGCRFTILSPVHHHCTNAKRSRDDGDELKVP